MKPVNPTTATLNERQTLAELRACDFEVVTPGNSYVGNV